MSITRILLVSLLASIAGTVRNAAATDLATHLFVLKDGDVYSQSCGNLSETFEVGRAGKKSVAWLTFQTGGFDAAQVAGSVLTLHVGRVMAPGTLKVYALTSPVPKIETQVGPAHLAFNYAAPIASIALTAADCEKLIRINLGQVLNTGTFHGLVLGSANGLSAEFNSKDSDIPPMVELKYTFASATQVQQVLDAAASIAAVTAAVASDADAADGSAADAAQSAALAAASAQSAGSSAAAALQSAANGAASATAAANSAMAAAASATQSAGSATASAASATAAGNSAAAAASSAMQSAGSAGASAASATAAVTEPATRSRVLLVIYFLPKDRPQRRRSMCVAQVNR